MAMQLFRYMSVIWQDYKATQNKKHKGVSASADFRYPLIIPIVYYEGKKEWTAGLHLKDRIDFSEEMVESIYGNAPDEVKEIYKKILWAKIKSKEQMADRT